MVCDDETNFPHKLLLINRQVQNLRKAFAGKSSTNIKLPKTQISMMIQSGGFLGRLLDPVLKTGLPLMKNVIKPLAKSVLTPLGSTAAASAEEAGKLKTILGSGCPLSSTLSNRPSSATLIISSDEMKEMIRIGKSLEDSGLLLKRN